MLEAGYELDTLSPSRLPVRWWLFAHVTDARPRGPRRGVVDRGFRFARGGRAGSAEEAQRFIDGARDEMSADLGRWRAQPSHALGPGGRLIPLDEVESLSLDR